MPHLIELHQMTKRFGDLVANDAVDLTVEPGEIHCLLGENGAGKTTLMKILFGLYSKDAGTIAIRGQQRDIRSPKEAIQLGIGMIHQHFMLVNRLTAAENIVAGQEPTRGPLLDARRAEAEVAALANQYGLRVNPGARIEDISVGEQQRVEILKALYRRAEILILDEPTAVLTPQEVDDLFRVLRNLTQAGKTIIFITHKLRETMTVADRITVLRDGRNAGTVCAADTDPHELARMMVGRDVVLRVQKPSAQPGEVMLEAQQLCAVNSKTHVHLNKINLAIRAGEIVGVAGVAGNGQAELEEALSGLRPVERGRLLLRNRDITTLPTVRRRALGMAHIPSDRLKRGSIPAFSVEHNLILGSEWHAPFAAAGLLSRKAIAHYARDLITQFQIRCSGVKGALTSLSGGNQQKVIIARELSHDPDVIIAAQPTRGVDVGAIEYIHNTLLAMRAEGKAILLISTELDELKSLSDRILVMYEGAITAEGHADDFSEQQLGLLMAGHSIAKGNEL